MHHGPCLRGLSDGQRKGGCQTCSAPCNDVGGGGRGQGGWRRGRDPPSGERVWGRELFGKGCRRAGSAGEVVLRPAQGRHAGQGDPCLSPGHQSQGLHLPSGPASWAHGQARELLEVCGREKGFGKEKGQPWGPEQDPEWQPGSAGCPPMRAEQGEARAGARG